MFALFAGDRHYPLGGWRDFRGTYKTKEEAIAVAYTLKERGYEWAHVVDLSTYIEDTIF
jgi:phosphoribosylformimino-5-aminoimidazole carboxamide ribonucleotide (ProFAR) isomerase